MLSRLFWREHRSSRDGAQRDTTTTATAAAQSARAGTSQQSATIAAVTAAAVVSTQAATATRASKHAHAVTAGSIDVISTQQQQQRQRQRRVPLVQLRPLTLVRVPSYRVRSNYVEYAVLCSEAHTAWRVHRRYQQFKDLDRALRQLCSKATTTTTTNVQPHNVAAHATAAASNTDNNNNSSHRCSCHGALPVLPSSHWMEVTNQSVERVERRRRLLEVYLQQLLVPANHFYLLHSPLYRFLHEGKVTVPHRRHNNNKDGGQTAATTMNGDEDDGIGIAPLPGLSMHASCSDNDDDDTMSKAHSGTDDKQTRCGSVQTTVTATTTTTTTTAAAVAQHVNVQVSPSPPPMLARDAVTAASSSSPPSTTTTSHEKAQSSSGDDDDETDARRRATLPLHMTSAQAAPRALRYAASVHSAASTPHHHRCCCCSADDVTAAAAAAAGGAVATAPRVSSTMWSEVAGAATTRTTTTSMSDVGTATTSTATMTMPPQTPQEQQLCEERLPACGATCTQCAAEYTSMRRPHRCYLCRCCVCSRCLTRVALSPCTSHTPTATAAAATDVHKGDECDGAGVWRRRCCTVVRVCAQCAENCRRRRERVEAAAHDVLPMSSSSSSGGGGGDDGGGSRAASSDRASSSASSSLSSSQYAHRRLSTTQAGVNEAATAAAAADDENTIEARNNNNNSSATCQQQLPRVSVHSFVLLTVLGQGTFGKVLKVRHRDSGVVYAMKVLSKAAVRRRGVATYVCEERHIFAALPPHPYVVRCHFAFQSRCHVFFVLDYVAGGELYRRLYPRRVLSRREAQLYAAEVVLAVQHLHAHDIAHRDVKPENVLLDGEGHIRLVDFGLARRHLSRTRRRSFVGSAEYVAPETIAGATQTVAVDWWGVGVLLYEMLVGQTPFRAASNAAVYERVLHDDVEALLASHDTLDAAAVSLLRGLLQRDVAARMRVAASLCEHAFFDGVDWQALRQRRVAAVAHVPELRFCDVRYFRRRYTAQWARLPTLPHAAAATATAPHAPRDSFNGFDYVTSSSSSDDEDDGGGACHDAEQHKNKTAAVAAVCDTTRTCDAHVSPSPLLRACSRAVLCGAWRAVAVEVRAVDGRVTYPWGGDVTGLLQHTPCTQHDADDTGDGVVLYYSMQLSASPSARPPRTAVRADALDDAAQADVCDVLSSCVASCGTCVLHVDSQCVVYTPHTHLMPGECGRPLRLGYELETTTMHGADDDNNNSSSSSRGRGGNTPSPLHVLRLYTPVQRVAVDEGDADGEADVHAVTVTTWVKLEDA